MADPITSSYQKSRIDYLGSSWDPGEAVDCFRAISISAESLSYLKLSTTTQEIVERVRSQSDAVGSFLSIPKFFKNISDLREKHFNWQQKGNFTTRFELWYQFVNIINTGSQAVLGLHAAKIVDLATRASVANGVNQVTTILTDGQSLYEEYSTEKKGGKTEKWLRIAKYTSSVALGVILLLGIFYAALLQQMAFLIFSLSLTFVLTSILSELSKRERESLLAGAP